LRNMHTPRFYDIDYHKFKKELPKYDGKDHTGVFVWIKKMDEIF
jgi:hypothetical protein